LAGIRIPHRDGQEVNGSKASVKAYAGLKKSVFGGQRSA